MSWTRSTSNFIAPQSVDPKVFNSKQQVKGRRDLVVDRFGADPHLTPDRLETMNTLTSSDRVQIVVAAATFILAVISFFMMMATRTLAKKTRDMANATREMASATQEMVIHTEAAASAGVKHVEIANRQAELMASALRASIVPWLTSRGQDAVSVEDNHTEIVIDIVMRNAGAGLAIIEADGCWIWPNPDYRSDSDRWRRKGQPTASVLAVGDVTRIRFLIAKSGDSISLNAFSGRTKGIFGDFRAGVSYADSRGGQRTYAQLRVGDVTGSGSWRIFRIDYRWENDSEPFAAVEFSPV